MLVLVLGIVWLQLMHESRGKSLNRLLPRKGGRGCSEFGNGGVGSLWDSPRRIFLKKDSWARLLVSAFQLRSAYEAYALSGGGLHGQTMDRVCRNQ